MRSKEIIRKLGIDALNDHFIKKYTVFELEQVITMLHEAGMNNPEIAKRLKISESSLYNIIPIRNISPETRRLIEDGKIDGYKAGRIMRIIGKDKEKEKEVIKEVIEKDMPQAEAERFAAGHILSGYDLNDHIREMKRYLSKNKDICLTKKEKEDIRIVILQLSALLSQ